MEVILKKDVENLGEKDELISVKPGYGRNFLIPQGMAVLATSSIKKMHEETLRQRSFKETKIREEAEKVAEKLAAKKLKIGAKVGENGKIFGSINNIQLADAIKKAGTEVPRKDIVIKEEPIKEIGNYEATVKIHKDITITVQFEVVEE